MLSDDTATTRQVLSRYEHELYGERNLDLVEELLADPMNRHDAGGKVTTMTNADCRERIGAFFRDYAELRFRTVHLIVDGPLASWTYELTMIGNEEHRGAETVISSIEIFEVRDGKITAVWNADYSPGPWA